MLGATAVLNMKSAIKEKGIAAHVGASYYLRHTKAKPYMANQNCDEFKPVIICSGVFTKIAAPKSTLVQSPAFTNAVDKASSEFGDWVAQCKVTVQGHKWVGQCCGEIFSWS